MSPHLEICHVNHVVMMGEFELLYVQQVISDHILNSYLQSWRSLNTWKPNFTFWSSWALSITTFKQVSSTIIVVYLQFYNPKHQSKLNKSSTQNHMRCKRIFSAQPVAILITTKICFNLLLYFCKKSKIKVIVKVDVNGANQQSISLQLELALNLEFSFNSCFYHRILR